VVARVTRATPPVGPLETADILAAMGLAANQSRHVLDGGARLLTAVLPDRASASLVLMFGVGSRTESDHIAGASHFIEHLLFKGTRRRPTAKLIAEAIEGVGGMINASTDKEITAYWARVPADSLALAVEVLCDIVTDSQLAPDDVERERMVILEELKMYLDQPQDYVHSLFEDTLWPGHPLGRDIIGSIESVSSTTRDDLIGYIARHYAAPNLVVGVAGSFAPDQIVDLISPHLRLPSVLEPSPIDAPTAPTEARLHLLNRKTEQAHICLGTSAVSYHDPERHALDLLNCVLGEGMSSRLFLEIRERRGLAYDVHSFTSKHRDAGYFGVYMGVDPKKAAEAVQAVRQEMTRLAREPILEPELIKAKEFTKGRLKLSLEGTNSLASWLCQQELLLGRIKTVAEVVETIDGLTAEDLQRVAERVLTQPVQMAVIGPFAKESALRSAIDA